MASLNKVQLIGNLGRDPEVRYTASGLAVGDFSIATTERARNKESQTWEDKTEWHKIVVWDKLAERCREYLHKGKQVYVEGRIQTRSWTDKDGNKRYSTEVVAQNVIFLGPRGPVAEVATAANGNAPETPAEATATAPAADTAPPSFDANEDVPF